jgi:galactokinase
MDPLAVKVIELFKKKFQKEPVLYFSPGRINLIGEHVDYNDGYVLPCAINKGIYFAVAANNSNTARFYSRDFDEKYEVDLHKIGPNQDWKNYVLSVVNEFQKDGKAIMGFDCALGGNIPVGAGMSSSAAVEGGLAFALNDIFQLGYDSRQLAFLCQRAEHGFPGVNCGIMDQYANMMGKKGHAIFLDCKNLTHEYYPLELGDYQLVLINTKVHHALAGSAYNTRRKECETGLNILRESGKFNSFRDIKNSKILEKFEEKMGKFVWKRCTFVVDEINRTKSAAKMLKKNNLAEFGRLMYQSHEGLSNLYKVSCAELDFLVGIAKTNPDVLGSRMMGGGFGGCTINIVKKEGKKKFVETSIEAYKKEFQLAAECYEVSAFDGTKMVVDEPAPPDTQNQ